MANSSGSPINDTDNNGTDKNGTDNNGTDSSSADRNSQNALNDERSELLAKLEAIDSEIDSPSQSTSSYSTTSRQQSQRNGEKNLQPPCTHRQSPATHHSIQQTSPHPPSSQPTEPTVPKQKLEKSPEKSPEPSPQQSASEEERSELLAALDAVERNTPVPKPSSAAPTRYRYPQPPKAPAFQTPSPKTSSPKTPSSEAAAAPASSSKPSSTPTPPAKNADVATPPSASTYPIPNVLEQLTLYAKEKLEARAEQRRKQQERAALEAKVQAWLDNLDPLSDDGFWFEQFAEGYGSRMEAAIAFLNPKQSP